MNVSRNVRKLNQKFASVCERKGAFSCGVSIFVWVLINAM